ncbi:MAG TPA: hypothetical protein VF493_16990 [Terriglobales bacterium]
MSESKKELFVVKMVRAGEYLVRGESAAKALKSLATVRKATASDVDHLKKDEDSITEAE